MRRVHVRIHSGFVGALAAVLPLLLLASACSRDRERTIVAPEAAADPPVAVGMRWIWEPEALAGAARLAGTSPLAQRALAGAQVSRLRPRHDLAIRAVGEAGDGTRIGLTILPYSVAGDPTRASFVSVAEGFGREAAEYAEMIVGREPRADEIGFHQVVWGNRLVWVRTGEAYSAATAGVHPAPMKRHWTKLFDCLVERMPAGCAAGAAIADEFAPNEPRAAAIGCGIGAAAGAGSCVADFLRGK